MLWHFVSGIAFVEAVKAAIRKEEENEAAKGKQASTIIMTGENAIYNENNK